jgi:hypothetical protein
MVRNDDGTLTLFNLDGTPCTDGDCYPAAILDDGSIYVLGPEEDAPANVLEVELGRLNIARAPDKVLDHALEEVLSKLDSLEITLEELALLTDASGRLLLPGTATAIDSPLENLALYQALLEAYGDQSSYIEVFDPVTGELVTTFIELSLETTSHDSIDTQTYTLSIELDAVPLVAASALAAASDKTGTLEIDEVAYLSKFLEVEDELAEMVTDFTDWYDRDKVYDIEMTVLTATTNPDDPDAPIMTWEDINLLDLNLFTDVTPIGDLSTGIDVFTQASDDAVQVLEYIHDNTVQ